MITKQCAPFPPQDPIYSQMGFDWANITVSGKSSTLVLRVGSAAAQVWIHWGSIKVHTLSALINTLTQIRGGIIFIDEALLGLYKKALNRHLEGEIWFAFA